MSATEEFFVGLDVGGTSARIQPFARRSGMPAALSRSGFVRTGMANDFTHLLRQLQSELTHAGFTRPLSEAGGICVAAAGLFNGRFISHPQYPGGAFDVQQALADLGLPPITVVNDFAAEVSAAALGASAFRGRHLCGPASYSPSGNLHVVGPGTGLGHACLFRREDRFWLQTTEAGHMTFPMRFAAEQGPLLRFIEARVSHQHPDGATVERVLSGDGLRLIIEHVTGEVIDPHAEIKLAELPDAVRIHFALHLGLQCANFLVGTSGQWNGLFLTGGVLKRNPDLIAGRGLDAFLRGLYSARRHAADLQRTSVWLMQEPDTGTLGAAAIAMGHLRGAF